MPTFFMINFVNCCILPYFPIGDFTLKRIKVNLVGEELLRPFAAEKLQLARIRMPRSLDCLSWKEKNACISKSASLHLHLLGSSFCLSSHVWFEGS